MPVMTHQLLNSLRRNGAFTRATIEALGLHWDDLRSGWTRLLIGKEFTDAMIERAQRGRNILSSKRQKQNRRSQWSEAAPVRDDNNVHDPRSLRYDDDDIDPEADAMTLRDYFAAFALAAVLREKPTSEAAGICYEIADAMLAERRRLR